MLLQRLIVIHISERRHVKACNPHIDNDYDTEVGFFLLKGSIQHFRAFIIACTAQVIIHIFLIVFADAGYHGHKGHFPQLPQICISYCGSVSHLFFFDPFRIFVLEYLQQIISNLSVGANYHCFLDSVRILCAGCRIMVMDINRQSFQTRRLFQNDIQRAHSFFAGFNIFIGSTDISTLLVIAFYLFNLFIVQKHLGNTRMVLNRYRKSVCNRLVHRIAVYFFTKGLVGFFNWCTGKAYKGCLRKGFSENLGIRLGKHGLHIFFRIFAELNLSGMFKLCSVGFIRKTDNIGTVVNKSYCIIFTVAEFLDSADIKADALSCTKLLTEMRSAFDNRYFTNF